MEKVELITIKNKLGKVLSENEFAKTTLLGNNEVAKIFSPAYINFCAEYNSDIFKKVLSSETIDFSEEIVSPNKIITNNDKSIGFITPKIIGQTYNQFLESQTLKELTDLKSMSKRHYDFEGALIKNPRVVFPDICTCDNIMIDRQGKLKFVDFDGLQIDKLIATATSSSLVDTESPKFFKNNLFFKTLDMQSSIVLYYLSVLNVNLKCIGQIIPGTDQVVTLTTIFDTIQLEDGNLYDITKNMLSKNGTCSYLGDSILRIAEDYNAIAIPIIKDGRKIYMKKLIKK